MVAPRRLPAGARVLVVGGGVLGLAVARELAGKGLRVTLLESRALGGGASSAAVGVLSAPGPSRSAFGRLCRDGYDMHAELAGELLEETGIDVEYRECGCLRLHAPPLPDREKVVAAWKRAGVAATWLEGGEIAARVPGYGGRFTAALHLDREAVVRPQRLLAALEESCRRRGVEVRANLGSLELMRASPSGVVIGKDGGETHEAAATVIAAGCWSARLLGRLQRDGGVTAPALRPVRGQALEIAHRAPGCVVHFDAGADGAGYYLVPRGEDVLWVGSTVEDAGFDERVTAGGQDELLDAARDVLPDLGEAHVVRQWCGLRPQAMRRGGPYLGPSPDLENVWLACGHYRSGILTAPPSARLLAAAMTRGEAIDAAFGVG